MDYSEKCYEKTALSQVLIRLDFHEFLDNNSLFCDDIENKIMPYYPNKGKQKIINQQTVNVQIDPNTNKAMSMNRILEGLQRTYNDRYGNKFILSNKYVCVECNHYTTYECLMNSFSSILKAILLKNQITITRTGVRYINIFNDDSIKPQKRYFASPVSALMDTKAFINDNCIRSLNLTEYLIDDMRLNFRYGMHNPYYPRPIKRPHFVLDYDCFCDSVLQGYENVIERINIGHDAIQDKFESSITDSLKKVMGNGRIPE